MGRVRRFPHEGASCALHPRAQIVPPATGCVSLGATPIRFPLLLSRKNPQPQAQNGQAVGAIDMPAHLLKKLERPIHDAFRPVEWHLKGASSSAGIWSSLEGWWVNSAESARCNLLAKAGMGRDRVSLLWPPESRMFLGARRVQNGAMRRTFECAALRSDWARTLAGNNESPRIPIVLFRNRSALDVSSTRKRYRRAEPSGNCPKSDTPRPIRYNSWA